MLTSSAVVRAARGALLATVVGLAALLGPAGPAVAHDQILGTDPTDGSTVPTPPGQVTLTFSEPPLSLGTELLVSGPAGAQVQQGPAQVTGNQVVQPLASGLPAGAYRVDWRVTASDGHVATGTFSFTAAAAGPGPTPTADASTPTPVVATPGPVASSSAPAAQRPQVTAPAGPSSASSGPPRAVVWVVVLAALLAVAAVGYLALRRRR